MRTIRLDIHSPDDLPNPLDPGELADSLMALIERRWGVRCPVLVVYDDQGGE